MASHIQTVTFTGNVTSSNTVIPLAVAAGDFLILYGTDFFTAVSDNINGAWTLLDTPFAQATVWYIANSGAAAANGMTVSVTATSTPQGYIIEHQRGIATSSPIRGKSHHEMTTSPVDGGTIAANPVGDVILLFGFNNSINDEAYTAGSVNGVAMTIGGHIYNSGLSEGYVVAYAESSASGDQTATMTVSPADANTDMMMFQVALKPLVTGQASNSAIYWAA